MIPSEASLQKARLNGHAHHANAGLTRLILETLRAGPLTADQLAQRLNRSPERIRHMLATLVHVTGGVVADGPKLERTYRLYVTPPRPQQESTERPYRVAGRITIGRGSLWGAGLA